MTLTIPQPPATKLYAMPQLNGSVALRPAGIAADALRPDGRFIDTHKVARTAVQGVRNLLDQASISGSQNWPLDHILEMLRQKGGAQGWETPEGDTSLTYAFVSVIIPKDSSGADALRLWLAEAELYAAEYAAEEETAIGVVEVTK